jgi:hypothetical protein
MKHICQQCQKEYENADKRSKFCCRSCAATFNGKMFPKRKRTRKCKNCDNLVKSGFTYCEQCVKNKVHYSENGPVEERTLEQELVLKKHKGANRYDHIRQHAVRIMKDVPNCCKKCNYSKHTEVCHIKAIKDFTLDTKISVINSKDNLVKLCPNCHWEFDRGLFSF